ncbi:sugar phosphate isomerase/epimerase family protein [Aquirufa rosea]|uniref:Sugar phosphate isomerase/epimerase n=1 Tax=Aquirufa rosea TaxID=2509241 RepID=A0A4Q1BX31_9BACT|nr:sugar phosphate isomerase/epimerase family protein [Aquirufa rosea]RXK46569.1 sugar phosphate isomerase/epimerase [Aquirufa rosea]
MIHSCVTIALVPQIKTGPWIFWNDLEKSMAQAASLGFDAIELFTADAKSIDLHHLEDLLKLYSMKLAAVGSGAGKVIQGLTLTDSRPEIRNQAISFIQDMMDFGAYFGAYAIIGSMQGNALPDAREEALSHLQFALEHLGKHAEKSGVPLIYEPLNRYETNLFNTLSAGGEFLDSLETRHVKLLADLFHMNIEETDIAQSIRENAHWIGHVHWADSNRRPVGLGHTSMQEIAHALKEIQYQGAISAEAFPWPDPYAAAQQTILSYQQYFKS